MIMRFIMTLIWCAVLQTAAIADAFTASPALILKHDGTSKNFAHDVFSSELTIVSFIFLNCDVTCPTSLATTAQLVDDPILQSADLRFVTISVDPLNDTPLRMNTLRSKLTASATWDWYGGTEQDIAKVMQSFGLSLKTMSHHSSDFYLVTEHGKSVHKIKSTQKKRIKQANDLQREIRAFAKTQ